MIISFFYFLNFCLHTYICHIMCEYDLVDSYNHMDALDDEYDPFGFGTWSRCQSDSDSFFGDGDGSCVCDGTGAVDGADWDDVIVADDEILWGVNDGGFNLCTADETTYLRLGPVPEWDGDDLRLLTIEEMSGMVFDVDLVLSMRPFYKEGSWALVHNELLSSFAYSSVPAPPAPLAPLAPAPLLAAASASAPASASASVSALASAPSFPLSFPLFLLSAAAPASPSSPFSAPVPASAFAAASASASVSAPASAAASASASVSVLASALASAPPLPLSLPLLPPFSAYPSPFSLLLFLLLFFVLFFLSLFLPWFGWDPGWILLSTFLLLSVAGLLVFIAGVGFVALLCLVAGIMDPLQTCETEDCAWTTLQDLYCETNWGFSSFFLPLAPDFIGSHPIFSHTGYLGAALRCGPLCCCVLVGAVSSSSYSLSAHVVVCVVVVVAMATWSTWDTAGPRIGAELLTILV